MTDSQQTPTATKIACCSFVGCCAAFVAMWFFAVKSGVMVSMFHTYSLLQK